MTATDRWLSSQTWVMPTFSPTIAFRGAFAGILSSYTRDAPLGVPGRSFLHDVPWRPRCYLTQSGGHGLQLHGSASIATLTLGANRDRSFPVT